MDKRFAERRREEEVGFAAMCRINAFCIRDYFFVDLDRFGL